MNRVSNNFTTFTDAMNAMEPERESTEALVRRMETTAAGSAERRELYTNLVAGAPKTCCMTVSGLVRALSEDLLNAGSDEPVVGAWQWLINCLQSENHMKLLLDTFLLKQDTFDDQNLIDYNAKIVCVISQMRSDNEVNNVFDEILKLEKNDVLIQALKTNAHDVPSDIYVKFLHKRVLPLLFDVTTNPKTKSDLVQLLLSVPIGFIVQNLSAEDVTKFKETLLHKYLHVIKIEESSPSSQPQWYDYIRVLIHHAGRLLHTESTLTNSILRHLETAFKSRTKLIRYGALDCWKELIDNYAIDRKQLERSSKLLLKPLRLRILRAAEGIERRCDVYAHFLEKQYAISGVMLLEFLESFLEVQPPQIAELVAVLPHLPVGVIYKLVEVLLKALRHDSNGCCKNKVSGLTDIYAIKAIDVDDLINTAVNVERLMASAFGLVQVIGCYLTEEDSALLINCTIESIFRLYKNIKDDKTQTLFLKQIALKVEHLICGIGLPNFPHIITSIIRPILSFIVSQGPCSQPICNSLVYPILIAFTITTRKLTVAENVTIYHSCFRPLLAYVRPSQTFLPLVNDVFANEMSRNFTDGLLQFSMTLICERLNAEPSDKSPSPQNIGILLENSLSKSDAVRVWGQLFREASFIEQTAVHEEVFRVLKKLAVNKDFSDKIMELVAMCLNNEHLNNTCFINILSILNELLLQEINLKSSLVHDNLSTAAELNSEKKFNCESQLEKLFALSLQKHKVYSVLSIVESHFKTLSADLQTALKELISHEDMQVSNRAKELLSKLHGSASVRKRRSSKIELVTEKKMKNDEQNNDEVEQNMIKLFGQSVASPKPERKVKGSLLQLKTNETEKPKVTTPKKVGAMLPPPPPIEDISDSAFVAVDTQVNFDPKKMNAHQKEVLKKRREDIPALYSNLSQSQSLMETESSDLITSDIVATDNGDVNTPETKENKEPEGGAEKFGANDKNAESKLSRVLVQLRMDVVGADAMLDLPRKRAIRKKVYPGEELTPPKDTGVQHNNEEHDPAQPKKRGRKPKSVPHVTADSEATDTSAEASAKTRRRSRGSTNSDLKSNGIGPRRQSNKVKEKHDVDTTPSLAEANFKDVEKKELHVLDTVSNGLSENETVTEQKVETAKRRQRKRTLSTETKQLPENKQSLVTKQSTESKQDLETKEKIITSPCVVELEKLSVEKLMDVAKNTAKTRISEESKPESVNSPSSADKRKSTPKKFTGVVRNNSPVRRSRVSLFKDKTDEVAEMSTQSVTDMSQLDDSVGISFASDLEPSTPIRTNSANNSELICSPMNEDTPNRNSQLISSTESISPIRERPTTPDIFNSEPSSESEPIFTEKIKDTATLKVATPRSVNLFKSNCNSPQSQRIRKMMMNVYNNTNNISCPNNDEDGEPAPTATASPTSNVLRFEKEVPEPNATPKNSILKRKAPDSVEDGFSPAAKRKRVYFSDPPTTCQKVYYKSKEETSPFKLKKKYDILLMMQQKTRSAQKNGLHEIEDKDLEENNKDCLEIMTINSNTAPEALPVSELLTIIEDEENTTKEVEEEAKSLTVAEDENAAQTEDENVKKYANAMAAMLQCFFTPSEQRKIALELIADADAREKQMASK